VVALNEQTFDKVAADKPGTTGDQYSHYLPVPLHNARSSTQRLASTFSISSPMAFAIAPRGQR
jgi:hypothetical protein